MTTPPDGLAYCPRCGAPMFDTPYGLPIAHCGMVFYRVEDDDEITFADTQAGFARVFSNKYGRIGRIDTADPLFVALGVTVEEGRAKLTEELEKAIDLFALTRLEEMMKRLRIDPVEYTRLTTAEWPDISVPSRAMKPVYTDTNKGGLVMTTTTWRFMAGKEL